MCPVRALPGAAATASRAPVAPPSRQPSALGLYLCSLYPHMFSRAYINFKNQEDIVLFRDRFDGYVFVDHKGKYTGLDGCCCFPAVCAVCWLSFVGVGVSSHV